MRCESQREMNQTQLFTVSVKLESVDRPTHLQEMSDYLGEADSS